MATPRLTEAQLLHAARLVITHGDAKAAAGATGIPHKTLQHQLSCARTRWPGWFPAATVRSGWALGTPMDPPDIPDRRLAERGLIGGPPIPNAAVPPEGFRVSRNSGAYDADGNLLRQWVGTVPDSGDAYAVPDGHRVKGESALLDPAGRVLARWVKTAAGSANLGGLVEALQAAFAAHTNAAPIIPAPEYSNDDLLTIYPIPDLHFGLYSWGAETGDDYDTDIAAQMAIRAVGGLVSQSHPSKRAVLLGLGDLFHQNDQKNATPGSGHRLDVDGRWARVFEMGARLMVQLVDMVAAKHETVEVVLIPGNHDEDAAVCLRVALALFYGSNPRIRVYNKPGLHWYHQHGKCLLGATHGHTMRPDRMAMMLAADQPKAWGETLHRSMFFGHIHHESAKGVAGVRVESFTTPAGKDGWAAGAGYRTDRAMSAITFHAESGEIGRHRVNIVAPAARAA